MMSYYVRSASDILVRYIHIQNGRYIFTTRSSPELPVNDLK